MTPEECRCVHYIIHGAICNLELITVPCFTQALGNHEVEIPETINTQTLVKDLAKEIRLVEVTCSFLWCGMSNFLGGGFLSLSAIFIV